MINFTKITYDEVSEILNRACHSWDGSENVFIDETKINADELDKLRLYLIQIGYIEQSKII
ncbi:hypothetical protein UFOVP1230_29 [uncultured Caudovirales phage]|uniref:Uncharacterized protein n=1 Tax=uncultured Caudovirales phage TaxID=2100421 RepID=A0A6J5R506_9CAUD|nr:hypothetical protein UFOVP1230_29 [uncultured Caudovirales phage]